MERKEKLNQGRCSGKTRAGFAASVCALTGCLLCGLLSGCLIRPNETEDVDSAAIDLLEEEETANVAEAMNALSLASSSRAQVIADSIAASSQSEAESIAASVQSEADSIAASVQSEADSIAASVQADYEAAIAASQAAHEAYLQQLCAGTNLVPGMVMDITDSDLPVIYRLFQNTVLVGDSRVEAAAIHKVLTENEVCYIRGAHAAMMVEKSQEAAYRYTKKVLFWLGLNDTIIYGENISKFIADYLTDILAFQAINPNCIIYVHCVTPVTSVSIANRPETALCPEYNQAVYDMCQQYGFHFIDGTTYIEGDSSYYEDGQHFTRTFYLKWVQDIANKMGLWEDANP